MFKVNNTIFLLIIFFSVFTIYFSKAVYWPYDSRWSLYTAMSIIQEHNTDIDEYMEFFEDEGKREVEKHFGHYYSQYPIGSSVMALPFVFVADLTFRRVLALGSTTGATDKFDFNEYFKGKYPTGLEFFIACFYMSLTVVLMFGLIRLFLGRKRSLLLTAIFAFGTAAWPTASRALWQHGPSMMMLILTLFFIIKAKQRPEFVQFAGLTLAMAYITRPTNSLSVILLTIYIFWQHREYFLRYLLWASVIAVPFLLHNLSVYHSLFSPYYQPEIGFAWSEFLVGLSGNMFSPARGLLVFSPIFIFSIIGFIIKIKFHKVERLDYFLIAIIMLHWIVISIWPMWWGGHSFGYRLFSDMVPYLIYFMVPFMQMDIQSWRWKKASWVVFLLLAFTSIVINGNGAVRESGRYWNFVPTNIDQDPKRLWDWRDPQFLSGILNKKMLK
ncbi:glycosyltransferase family 39 protein [bacterium]|nr:glycosyltransferase family 39 protein [bacterium]